MSVQIEVIEHTEYRILVRATDADGVQYDADLSLYGPHMSFVATPRNDRAYAAVHVPVACAEALKTALMLALPGGES